ncbi:MAG TPA: DUF6545 domain-containing protein [Azospirillaceae bacterium]|nr:DUF6545 domain-containing protein [Azospirillaceae bacterium]
MRHQREWTLALTASVLIHAGLVFLLATPAIYRAVGTALRSPNICALLVPCITLVCVAHAHAMSQLWQPERRDARALRRTALRWLPVYEGALVTMAVLYALADLGPAAPLRFSAAYAHVPEVVALHVVYWTALISTIVVTVRECRSLSIPGRPDLVEDLKQSLRFFALALSLDLVNVALNAAALIGSAIGPRPLYGLAESAWLATIASCIAANIALGALVLRSHRAERRDLHTLWSLHDLVVGDLRADRGAAGEQHGPRVVLAPGQSWWSRFDTSLDLTSMMAEIHDAAGRLSPWWSPLPSLAAERLAEEAAKDGPAGGSNSLGDDWDLTAAQAAATLLFAARGRDGAQPPIPTHLRVVRLPGADTEPHAERQHLVRVARHLLHPIVTEAVTLAEEAQATASPS